MGKRKRSAQHYGDDDQDDPQTPDGMGEYYNRMMEGYDETTLTQKIYAKQSEMLQKWVKSLWDRSVSLCMVVSQTGSC